MCGNVTDKKLPIGSRVEWQDGDLPRAGVVIRHGRDAAKLNTAKYEAVPILAYLQSINGHQK